MWDKIQKENTIIRKLNPSSNGTFCILNKNVILGNDIAWNTDYESWINEESIQIVHAMSFQQLN